MSPDSEKDFEATGFSIEVCHHLGCDYPEGKEEAPHFRIISLGDGGGIDHCFTRAELIKINEAIWRALVRP